MSRSLRTDTEQRKAERNIPRDDEGTPLLPRVIERRPSPGDSHPLPAYFLRKLLAGIPAKYYYGLRYIELRPRPDAVGNPFGLYRPAEKGIVLYSLPDEWTLPTLSQELRQSVELFFADVREDGSGFHISWQSEAIRALWFYCYVMAHELGHHLRYQYRRRSGRRGRTVDEETFANLHSLRLTVAYFKEMRASRSRVL